MKKQIIEIAEFDGWNKDGAWFYKKGRWVLIDIYTNDLNELHRVALDVIHKVSSVNMIHKIHHAMLSRPINGEYTDLVDAVYEAIVYLENARNA